MRSPPASLSFHRGNPAPYFALALAALTFATRAAGAEPASDPIALITQLVDSADFDGAEAAAERALASGTLSRSVLAGVHLELGVIASARKESAKAQAQFRRALALDGDLSLRESAGPHVADDFARAREAVLARAPMKVQASIARGKNPTDVVVTARVTTDPEALARSVLVETDATRSLAPVDPTGAPFVEHVAAVAERCVTVTASIVDEHANSVWPNAVRETLCPPPKTTAAVTAPAAKPSSSDPPADPGDRATPAYVWLGVGLTGALAVATTVLGVVALDDRSAYHEKNHDPNATVAERHELESAAKASSDRATVAGIATGAVGAVTLVLYLTRPSSDSRTALGLSSRGILVSTTF